jgi:hypothetical protein
MIIKQLYLYWKKADWLWRTERFMLFVVCMVFSSIFVGTMTSFGILIFGPWSSHPAIPWIGFLAGALTVVYWTTRWSRYNYLYTNNKMDIKGNIENDGWLQRRKNAKVRILELEIQKNREALNFAREIKLGMKK